MIDHLWQHDDPTTEARQLLALAVKLYKPRAIYGLFSGGHDSLVATHLAAQLPRFTGVAKIDTTVGVAATNHYVAKVCERFGWPLRVLVPEMTYEMFCAKFGMPGPGRHDYVYAYLKERCVRRLVRDSKRRPRDRVMLVTGVRLSESERRMGHVEAIHRAGAQLWVAPCINWSREQREVYRVNNGLPSNPIVAALGMSGECLCGAFAKPGELEKVRAVDPVLVQHIEHCQTIAARNEKPCRWGERPNKNLCQQCDRKNGEQEAA
jgi:3'-phosphoadenosine 5'-phosphosulfate sulfotransferase (PAPS reductase)/FAD synthetase